MSTEETKMTTDINNERVVTFSNNQQSALNQVSSHIITNINNKSIDTQINQDFEAAFNYVSEGDFNSFKSEIMNLLKVWITHSKNKPSGTGSIVDNGIVTVGNNVINSVYQNIGGSLIAFPVGKEAYLANGGITADANGKLYLDFTNISTSVIKNVMKGIANNASDRLVLDANGKLDVNFDGYATVASVNAIQQSISDDLSNALDGLESSLTAEINTVSSTVNANQLANEQAMTALRNDTDTAINAKAEELTSNINSAKSEVQQSINQTANSLRGEFDNNISNVSGDIGTLSSSLSANTNAIRNMEGIQAELQNTSRSLSDSLTNYTNRVNEELGRTNSLISSLQNQISGIDNSKLGNISLGNGTTPIYFINGVPTLCDPYPEIPDYKDEHVFIRGASHQYGRVVPVGISIGKRQTVESVESNSPFLKSQELESFNNYAIYFDYDRFFSPRFVAYSHDPLVNDYNMVELSHDVTGNVAYGCLWCKIADQNGVGGENMIYMKITATNDGDTLTANGNAVQIHSYSLAPDDVWKGTCNLGNSASRWGQLYASDGTINTSDEREKGDIVSVNEDILNIWENIDFRMFKMKKSMSNKGDGARVHTGVIAQQIKKVFDDAGIDVSKLAFFCHDDIPAQEEVRLKNGRVVQQQAEAYDLYSIRYEELLCIEAAYLRKRVNELETRIAELEAKVNV